MNFEQYRKEAARTCVVLDDESHRQHMILGIISEVGELADAYKKHLAYGKELDKVNVLEEIADIFWYVANWVNTRPEYSSSEVKFIKSKDLETGEEETTPSDFFFTYLQTLHLGKLNGLVNKTFSLGIHLGFTIEEVEKALDNNIAKLRVRYPEKFTQEKAMNRDLESERKELEK